MTPESKGREGHTVEYMVSNVTTELYTLDLFTLGVENIKKERSSG